MTTNTTALEELKAARAEVENILDTERDMQASYAPDKRILSVIMPAMRVLKAQLEAAVLRFEAETKREAIQAAAWKLQRQMEQDLASYGTLDECGRIIYSFSVVHGSERLYVYHKPELDVSAQPRTFDGYEVRYYDSFPVPLGAPERE